MSSPLDNVPTLDCMGERTWTAIAVAAAALVLAAPAHAGTNEYVQTLENAELINHGGNPYHCTPEACFGQFDNPESALQTGQWVCDQLRASGKPRDVVVDWLSHGEGLMPSSYSAPIIVDAAATHLCPI